MSDQRLSARDRAVISSYIDRQLRAYHALVREREQQSTKERAEENVVTEYVVASERLGTAQKVVRERLRVIEIEELSSFMETVEWEHRLYFESNGVPRLRLSDLETVMLAAGLIAIQETGYEKRELREGELPGARRGGDAALDSIPF